MTERQLICLSIFVGLIELLELVSDWGFWVSVYQKEPGLVHGEVDEDLVWALLVFTILSTIAQFIEIILICAGAQEAWMSIPVLLLPEMVQLILSLMIAVCREEMINVFQLIKAGTVLFKMLFMRPVIVCTASAHDKCNAICIGIVIWILAEIALACAIFGVTLTVDGDKVDVQFDASGAFTDMETTNNYAHFSMVGVFLFWPFLAAVPVNDTFVAKTPGQLAWLRLFGIGDIVGEQELSFNIGYGDLTADVMGLEVKKIELARNETECFHINKQTGTVDVRKCGDDVFSTKMFFRFKYEPPGSPLPSKDYGDIHYNLKVVRPHGGRTGNCTTTATFGDAHPTDQHTSDSILMRYFKFDEQIRRLRSHHVLWTSTTDPRFFYGETDLTDITDVWKSGWGSCESSAKVQPSLDTSLDDHCGP